MKDSKKKRTMLIIDDDRAFCSTVISCLATERFEIDAAHSGAEGLKVCSRKKIDVVLLDQRLPDGEGHSFCQAIMEQNDRTKIIFITAYPSFEGAVKAIKAGAHDYLSKPFELEQLSMEIDQAFRTIDLEKIAELQDFKSDRDREDTTLIGGKEGFAEILRLVDLAAAADAPVLITGETGVGKNAVAKAIHYRSALRKAPFVCINCAAIPENLMEAELFGCERGAFTGAISTRKGIFEMAEGGTLVLDEIGNMPYHLQAKLLGVLEDKMIKRLGGETIIPVDVRIIAATSSELENEMGKTFRKELYYRLSIIRIHIPPLRERRQDIPDLCAHFLKKLSVNAEVRLSDSEVGRLMSYDWPGNVRELNNILERSFILRRGAALYPSALLAKPEGRDNQQDEATSMNGPPLPLKAIERKSIQYALAFFSGNISKTAAALEISLSTLQRKLKEYNLK